MRARRAAHRARPWAAIGLLALAYAITAKLGQQFATTTGGVTAVWPASGVALAALLLYGRGLWPGIAIGATLGSASLAVSPLAAGVEGVAATIQALVAVYLARRAAGFSLHLTHLRGVAAFFIAVVAGALLAALIGVGGLLAAGIIGPADYLATTIVWLVGDALGALVVAPLILTLRTEAPHSRARPVEAAAVLLTLAFVAQGIFVGFGESLAPDGPVAFAVVPLIVWAALRLGPRGAALAVALLSVFVVVGTFAGTGPFADGPLSGDLMVAQAFLAVIAGTALALAAVTAERTDAADALERETATLVESEAHTRRILETANDAFIATDPEGCITGWNQQAELTFGWSRDEALGRRMVDLIVPPAHRRAYGRVLARLHDHGSRVPRRRMQLSGLHRDGRQFLVELAIWSTQNGAGHSLNAFVHDITERVRYQDALDRQQHFLEAVLENLGDGIVACDADGRLTLFNRASRELHGLPAEPITPERWADHYDLYDADGTTPLQRDEIPLYRALKGERVRDQELVVAPKGAVASRLIVSGQAIVAEDGRSLGAVVAMHDITERKLLEEQLTHRAFHDPLTSLPNRTLFSDRVRHALERRGRPEGSMAVLFLDLDDFKAINDTLGHEAGDEVLVVVASRLRSCVRTADTVARFGGDEFAVLLEESGGIDAAMRAADRILKLLATPLRIQGREVSTAASMGIAVPGPAYEPAEILLRNADVAMYQAKSDGKGRRRIFHDEMREALVQRLDLKADLKSALRLRQFRLHYQPIVALDTGRVVGFEALLRWKHPLRGSMGPGEFIPLAEQSGLIVPIGRWVLREACRQMARWQRRFPHQGPLTVSVNLSARQLRDPGLGRDVVAALAQAELPAERLTLEITESLLIEDPEGAVEQLGLLKRLGVRIAIDDFGTGYSSLGYLTRYPIDTLKIDKTFTDTVSEGVEGSAVARLIIDLGERLGLQIVAEGIERQEQAAVLLDLRCHLGQGYLYAPALEARRATDHLARRPLLRAVS